jgi:DNA-binding NarL/FixJ family response regulator
MSSIRIVIADDHPIFRDGLKRLLESEPELSVVGEAAEGREAVRLVAEKRPDVLLLDLAMPHGGLVTLRDLAKGGHSARAILLTATIGNEDIVQALETGARGVVLKESATDLLFKSIRCVMAGEYWVLRESTANVFEALKRLQKSAEDRGYGLTPREQEIVAAIVAGLNNRQIAQRFTIAEQTVKHHLSSIYEKLDVSTRLELAMFAVRERLVSDPPD